MARLLDTSPRGPLPTDPVIGTFYDVYGQSGMDDLLAGVEADIAQYLHYDPILGVHVNEEGALELVVAGEYAGRYFFELQHFPLPPGLAPSVVHSLTFTYAASFIGPTQVDTRFATLTHTNGEVWALAPGVPEGLAGMAFGAGNTVPSVQAVGYLITYAAGFATGINDPRPDGGGTGFAATLTCAGGQIVAVTVTAPGTGYTSVPFLDVSGDGSNAALVANLDGNGGIDSVQIVGPGISYTHATLAVTARSTFLAPALPATIRRAGLFLLREAVLMEVNTQFNEAFNPAGGTVTSITDGAAKITWEKPQYGGSGLPKFCLGYGSPLAKAAEKKLYPLKRSRPFTMI